MEWMLIQGQGRAKKIKRSKLAYREIKRQEGEVF
jgi:hypothetical protein